MDNKWIEMETKISYQEYMIDQLNGVVTNQQERIDHLEEELSRMELLMKEAKELKFTAKELR